MESRMSLVPTPPPLWANTLYTPPATNDFSRAGGARRMIFSLLPLTLLACLAAPLAADEQFSLEPLLVLGDSPELPMDAISQSGSRLGLSVRETPATMEVIDQQRMQERGVRDTTEAVTGAAGFTSGNTGGNLSGFSARGFNDVAILYDGIGFGRPGMFARPQGSWIYQRVETLSGPASILHGEGATAGAVNFVPRRPNPNATETDLLMSAGSFNSTRVAAGHGGPTGVDGLSLRIDGERQSSDGYTDNSNLRRDTISASLRYDASDRLRITANLVYLDDSLPPYWGAPVDPERGEPGRDLARSNFNARDASIEGEEWRLTLDVDYQLRDNVQLRNRFYAYDAERDWVNVESSEITNGELRQRFAFSLDHFHSTLANRSEVLVSHSLFGREARSSLGLEVSRDDYETNRSRRPDIDRDVGDRNNPDTGSVREIGFDRSESVYHTKRDTLALFGENQLLLGGGFSLISGLRGEVVRLDAKENDSGDGEFNNDRKSFNTSDARLGFLWETGPRLALFGQASTGSRLALNINTPRVDQLDRRFERSRGFELGLRGQSVTDAWEWQAVAFDMEKRNRLVNDPDEPNRQRQVGRQTSQGLELSGLVKPLSRLTVEANATVLNAELRDEAGLDGNTPANVPERLGNLWATWDITHRASAQAQVRYVGAAEANNANTLEIPSHTVLNLSGELALDQHWTLAARLRNVTDELYYTQAQFGPQFYVGDGRSVELELRASF
ncbi:MAG: TonB-dependent receptor [Halomonadaceae bacterium]|nr:MAG: TonB-dependent receptor [Halomonadaceae bacterium]